MKRIFVVPQRDLLGQLTEWLVVLEDEANRWGLETVESLTQARQKASDYREEHRANRVTILDDREAKGI